VVDSREKHLIEQLCGHPVESFKYMYRIDKSVAYIDVVLKDGKGWLRVCAV
jgi:hypothetical protein